MWTLLRLTFLSILAVACAQRPPRQVPSSFPQDYPGKPQGDFSPEWQNCRSEQPIPTAQLINLGHLDYEVTGLPNISFSLQRNWAGNIPVNRANHPNDTLFFWAFERENGSLTSSAGERSNEPWGIWLNGG